MSKSGAAVVVALALAAGACATPMETGPAPTAAPAAVAGLAPPSAPAPVPDYDWISHVDSDSAALAYGLAQSDDVPLLMSCRPRSGRVEISRPAERHRDSVVLSSNGAVLSVPVVSEPSELHEGVFLTGEAATSEAALQEFRRAGWLSLHEDGSWHGLAGHGGSGAAIDRFFSACG